MKKLVVFAIVIFVAYTLVVELGESKAEAKIGLARSMAEEGRYEEAIQTYDDVEEWFGWTEASRQVIDLRAEVVKEMHRRDEAARRLQEEAEQERRQDDYEAQQEAFRERQEDARRRAEEARKKVDLLTGGG